MRSQKIVFVCAMMMGIFFLLPQLNSEAIILDDNLTPEMTGGKSKGAEEVTGTCQLAISLKHMGI